MLPVYILASSFSASILPALIRILVVAVVGSAAFFLALLFTHKNMWLAIAVFIAVAIILLVLPYAIHFLTHL